MDELQTRLSSYLDFLETTMKDGTELAMEQVPLVVQEFLAWEFYYNIIWGSLILGIVTITMSVILFLIHKQSKVEEKCILCKGSFSHDDKKNYCQPPHCVKMFSTIAIVLSAVATVPSLIFLLDALKIHVAPRVYVLEHIAELIK